MARWPRPGRPVMARLPKMADPTPQVRGIRKQIVSYRREDGVPLSFTLYLPPNYKDGTAGQVSGSTDRFTQFTGAGLHLLFLLHGYWITPRCR